MKILAIDTAIDGHHIAYLNEIVEGCECEFTIVLPEKTNAFLDNRVLLYSPVDLVHKDFRSYIKWMRELSEIAKKEKPDIVHFLYGDVFYKYFGLGLGFFDDLPLLITLHWIRPGILQHISLKNFCKKADRVVVHSEYLLHELQKMSINNGVHIEYPQFKRPAEVTISEAKKYWDLSSDIPVILSLGNTRFDKGIDILIEALNKVNCNFQLLIAGKAENFDEKYISEHTSKFAIKPSVNLRYLSDEEVDLAIVASDIVALPYRYSFNGASGPLGEGVWHKKCIIGSNHGNLGAEINNNDLGYTFKTEDPDSLAQVLDRALTQSFIIDEKYMTYRSRLDPALFVKEYKKLYNELKLKK